MKKIGPIEIATILIIGFLAVMVLAGCERERSLYAQATRTSVCVAGVRYLVFTSGVSVMYSPDGRVVTCTLKR